MATTRREFIRNATTGGIALSVLGFDLAPALAQVRELKIARTTEPDRPAPTARLAAA